MKMPLLAAFMGLLVTAAASGQMLVNGAGSTFDYPVLSKMVRGLPENRPVGPIQLSVDWLGRRIAAGAGADGRFCGASDAPMTDKAIGEAPGKILHFPIVTGGEPMVYNLLGHPRISSSMARPLAGIYLGRIN